jgi:transcriptional regulator with XRE-family HTH domain
MDPRERTEQIGRRIRAAREAKGLSQNDLAKRLPGSVSAHYVSRWETGYNRPSAAHLEMLAAVLDVPVAFFYANDS